ncbi:MAG: imidazole glycerol phosphate synthase subunit HisH [Synergistaceae bacterium]|jgi:glutamine amidotransferase|nr:imidazole glycerol phosphate synthase subunit HisH [Synergistaceae bacterium]
MSKERARLCAGVINYGAGNLGNVLRALSGLNVRHEVLERVDDADGVSPSILILPGVGAFPPAMGHLVSSGWADFLRIWAKDGRPIVGICVGLQLLCSRSSEDVPTEGLGLLEGSVDILKGVSKIPHMGWNSVEWGDGSDEIADPGRNFYFVHSYAVAESPHCIGTTEVDGAKFCSAMRNRNVAGFQFHPERSGREGVRFLGRAIRALNEIYSREFTSC